MRSGPGTSSQAIIDMAKPQEPEKVKPKDYD
jgi:hypothetical protein